MTNTVEGRNSSLFALAVGRIPKVMKGVNDTSTKISITCSEQSQQHHQEQHQHQHQHQHHCHRLSSSTQSIASMRSSIRSSFSGECEYFDSTDDHQQCYFQSRGDEEEDEYFYYYESGSLKLLDACRIREAQHRQQYHQKYQRRHSQRQLQPQLQQHQRSNNGYLPDASAVLRGGDGSTCALASTSASLSLSPSASPPDQLQVQLDQEVTIDDAVKSIVNSSDSWAKVRERIRSQNLVTNQGVFEVCLSYFQEEADRIKKERIDEARKAEARLSKISRLRRRLSLF